MPKRTRRLRTSGRPAELSSLHPRPAAAGLGGPSQLAAAHQQVDLSPSAVAPIGWSRPAGHAQLRAGVDALPAGRPEDTAVVILNYNGRQILPTCVASALQLTGLSGPPAVVVVDNGSTDGSGEYVQHAFPGITVLRWDDNLGFAAGNNRAAEALDHEFVLFVNNDTCLAPDVLVELARHLGGEVACTGARLVDWSGRRLDFDGGGAALTGHGHALGYGRLAGQPSGKPRPTLFSSGAAMFIHRPTFLRLGGFDADYFCYYEDVDLGWRLWLAGYRVLHLDSAVVRHRHGATARPLLAGRQQRMYERNALATVVKNASGELLERLLPAVLGLAAVRAGAPRSVIREAAAPGPWSCPTEGGQATASMAGDADRTRSEAGEVAVAAGGPTRPEERLRLPLPGPGWSGWPYLTPLALDWPALALRRAAIQEARRRPDDAILPLFAQPYAPVPPDGSGWWALVEAVEAFGLQGDFGPLPRRARAVAWLQRALQPRARRR